MHAPAGNSSAHSTQHSTAHKEGVRALNYSHRHDAGACRQQQHAQHAQQEGVRGGSKGPTLGSP